MSYTVSNRINFPMSISMETAIPLDSNSVFTDFSEATAAASTAVTLGSLGSKYYIGQIVTIADATSGIYKTYRIDTDKTLKELAAEYSFGDGLVEYISPEGTSVVSISPVIYSRLGIVYTTLVANSADWKSTFSTVRSVSGKWENTSNEYAETSGLFYSAYNTLKSTSADWEYSYAVINQWNNRWSSTYTTVKSTSGNWEQSFDLLQSTSGTWNDTASYVSETSGRNDDMYSTVYNTSSTWNKGYAIGYALCSITPEDAWLEDNGIADKHYVINQIRANESYFRGSFATWADVPATVDGYNSDVTGSKTPSSNDYMIVRDDSARTMTCAVSANPVGETIAENVVVGGETIFYTGHVIVVNETVDDIATLTSHGVSTIVVFRTGSWRFKYTGVWSSGGRNNWSSEYRLNTTVLTEAQIAAINSGITKNKTIQISKNAYDIYALSSESKKWNSVYAEVTETSADFHSAYTTVNETSGKWETVTDKLNSDYLRYYSASAWSILTDDDTDYSNVPSGLIFIYEEDGTDSPIASADMSIYTKDDGLLLLSKKTYFDYDFGTLYIGGAASFNTTSCTLTIPGSSDADGGSVYDSTNNIFTFSNNVQWDEQNGTITLTNGDKYNDTTSTLTLNGHVAGEVVKTTYSVTYNLIHATSSETKLTVNKGDQFITTISANSGYTLSTVKCTMGGINIDKTGDAGFNISSVYGDIVITAEAVAAEVTEYTVTNSLIACTTNNPTTTVYKGESYSATITPLEGYEIYSKVCLMNNVPQDWWTGNTIDIDYVYGNITIYCAASSIETESVYYSALNQLVLPHTDISYNSDTGVLILGNTFSLSGSDILILKGYTRERPVVYHTITKNLNNVTIDNDATSVLEGSGYYAKLSISNDNYEFTDLHCYMGSVEQTISQNYEISIPVVTGNIIISATAAKVSMVEYDSDDSALRLQLDASFVNNTLYLGRNSFYSSDTGSLEFSGGVFTNGSVYSQTTNVLTLGNNSRFYNNILTLGSNNTFETDTLSLGV